MMVFIGGVHGVGKSFFCNKLLEITGISTFSASKLIEERKNITFKSDKLIVDIDDNQNYLLDAVDSLKDQKVDFVLDGHFCLLDGDGNVTRIPEQTFSDLKPDAIVLLTEKPEIIAERRNTRDGIKDDIELIRRFQNEEVSYAREVSEKMSIPIYISGGAENIERAIDFIQNGGDLCGR